MPLTMVRFSSPSAILNFKSFFILGTFSHSSTVPTRMSSLSKSSMLTVGFTGFACRQRLRLPSWWQAACPLVLDDVVFYLFEEQFRLVQGVSGFQQVGASQLFQLKVSMFSILRSFSELKGKNGSKAIERFATSCRAMLRIVATRSISVFASFHGSVSARYLLPMRARFIASFCASRNLNTSSSFSTCAFTSANSCRVARS